MENNFLKKLFVKTTEHKDEKREYKYFLFLIILILTNILIDILPWHYKICNGNTIPWRMVKEPIMTAS